MSTSILPKNSLVLVTGCSGYIGSAFVQLALQQGYRVRGTTRLLDRGALLQRRVDQAFGPGRFELVEVVDLYAQDAYAEALRGVDGLVHIAGDVSFGVDPQIIVEGARKATLDILESANRAKVQRVVLTSSRCAVFHPFEGHEVDLVKDSKAYNEQLFAAAYEWPQDHPLKAVAIYAASKISTERTGLAYVTENKTSFDLNTVIPDYVMGETVNPTAGSTGLWMSQWILGDQQSPAAGSCSVPCYYADVHDVARIYFAALIEPDVTSERLWAVAAPFTINDILSIVRKHHPTLETLQDQGLPFSKPMVTRIENARSLELLRRQGREGWTSLEESTLANIASHEALYA